MRVRDARHPRTRAAEVRLTVAGTGMSRAVLLQIREPVFTTQGATGTGLSLWITSEIVRRHRGTIRVRRRTGSQHQGSTIFFPHPELPPAS